MRRTHRDVVSALFFSKDNKLLMGKKDPKAGGVYKGSWHIPGGGVNENEDKVQALIREVKEEVGIDVSKAKIELIDDQGKGESEKILKETGEKVVVEMDFFVYRINLQRKSHEVNVQLNSDLVAYKWFNLNELKRAILTPPSVYLFEKLGYLN